jgi:hypothetical protein
MCLQVFCNTSLTLPYLSFSLAEVIPLPKIIAVVITSLALTLYLISSDLRSQLHYLYTLETLRNYADKQHTVFRVTSSSKYTTLLGLLLTLFTMIYQPSLVHYTGCSARRLIGHWLTRVIKTEQSKIDASVIVNYVTLTDPLIRWSSNEWPSVCREIQVSADEMFWTSNKLAK